MDLNKIIDGLHPLEQKVLPVLDKCSVFIDIVKASGLKKVEVMRALQWLQNKEIIKLSEEVKELIELGDNGIKYAKVGLPEKRFLEVVKTKALSFNEIMKKSGLAKDELSICLGVLRSKAAVLISKERGDIKVRILDQGKKLLEKGFLEEDFLAKEFPIEIESLKDEEKFCLDNLKKRKNIVKIVIDKEKEAELTDLGKKIIESGIKIGNVLDRLTKEVILEGSWKKTKFRRYDVKINVPKIWAGKKQHYRRFLDQVRQKFISMGFNEMNGPIVETEFWNTDSLFMPQFHSARDIHDAYYVKDPASLKLDPKLVKNVKEAHENGFGTGSKGWQYEFDIKRTHNTLLRTQGTACSARMLSSPDLKIPGKYFGVTRCFRSDVIDATHNCDFYQTEGIVVEEGLDFRHLKGLLKMFAEEFAETEQIKIKPAYFPFTEPSAELFAKHPDLGWIELGGSGIFRPELVKPLLGRDVSVLAWGLGVDRLGMFKLGIKDIRKLFSHDLDFMRNVRII